MSRDNYQRKEARRREHDRRRWTCKNPAGCTFVFNPAAVEAGIAAEARAARMSGTTPGGPTTVVCATCNTFHFRRADRNGVRLLTPAETFQLYVDVPRAATDAETRKIEPGTYEIQLCRVED